MNNDEPLTDSHVRLYKKIQDLEKIIHKQEQQIRDLRRQKAEDELINVFAKIINQANESTRVEHHKNK